MSGFRRRLRHLRFFLQAGFSAVLIAAALLVGCMRLALPWLAANPERIEGWLGDRIGRAVDIGKVDWIWTRSGPRLLFDRIEIAAGTDGTPALELARTELALNLYAAFQKNRAWNEFRLVGLKLGLSRDESGVWSLSGDAGLSRAAGGGSMGALGAVVLADLDLSIEDSSHQVNLKLHVPELRVVNLGNITRVLGQLEPGLNPHASPPLSLVADIDMAQRSGQLYAGGRQVDLAGLGANQAMDGIAIRSGTGSLELWASWEAGRVQALTSRMELGNVVLQGRQALAVDAATQVEPQAAFDRLRTSARWQRKAKGWSLDLADTTFTQQGLQGSPARASVEFLDGRASAQVDALELGPLASLAMLSGRVPEKARRWLYLASPRGKVRNVDLRWNGFEDFSVDAGLDGLSMRSVDGIPGVDPLSGELHGDSEALLLNLPRQASRIELPKVFRKAFELSRLDGDVLVWRDAGDWIVRTPRLLVDGEEFSIVARGGLAFQSDHTRPLIDLAAVVTHAKVNAAKLFWPVNTMSETVVHWLDRGLVAGDVTGHALARGDLDHWPFLDNSGRFEAQAWLKGLELDYLADWPSGKSLDATATFINNGMLASASNGTALQIGVDHADATIDSFHDARLLLDITAHGTGEAMLSYLRATPIGKNNVAYLSGVSIGGNGEAGIKLDIPLKNTEGLKLDGQVQLKDATLSHATWDLSFTKANGPVRFDSTGVRAESLATQYEGNPVTLALAIGGMARDADNVFEASLEGVLPTSVVFARATDLLPALPRFPGQSNWHVGLEIGAEKGPASARRLLKLDSDLVGVAINLPAPLGKSAERPQAFSLALAMPPAGEPFLASLGDEVHVQGRMPGVLSPFSARLDFGSRPTALDLPARGLHVAGQVRELDADGWIGLVAAGGGGDELLQGMQLEADSMRLGGREFPQIGLQLSNAADLTSIRVNGKAMQGEISVPRTDLNRRGITAHMQHLSWPDPPAGSTAAPAIMQDFSPSSMPPLHLWIEELHLGSANLGELRLESFPSAQGMRIDLLEAKSPNVDMRASGDWTGSGASSQSHFSIDMTAENLGSMLDAFGFDGIIDGGQTIARINASWPGTPAAFALANTSGSLEIEVGQGRILDVEPGAGGRLFGLLSLREIPRRLALDFSDLFKSGMSFNSIKGHFELRDGNAYTNDLAISSPSADITITGRTGLRDKDYEQDMVVIPRAGVALPVVGALAGGPVGAAAGLVVQSLIGKRLNRAARSHYTVTGSWQKPLITLISREQSRTQDAAYAQHSMVNGLPGGGGLMSSSDDHQDANVGLSIPWTQAWIRNAQSAPDLPVEPLPAGPLEPAPRESDREDQIREKRQDTMRPSA